MEGKPYITCQNKCRKKYIISLLLRETWNRIEGSKSKQKLQSSVNFINSIQ